MSRRRQKPPRRLQIPIQELNAIVERTRDGALPEAEQATLRAAVDTLARVTAELESTQTTLARVQRIVFGSPSERTAAVLGEAKTGERPPANARRVRRQRPAKRTPVVRRQVRPIRTRDARRRSAPGTVATAPRTIPARRASRSPMPA
ncbi:hypothetical protein [Accumulibacter sp.]|uniref:hypothetical protein n=1 Tax=Accumulibacter sp. TaxID=2053492 RepID=UPI002600399A|nr:hypothetical protein [Accumulibacter sp.]